MLLSTNFIANKTRDLGNIMLNKTTSTLMFPTNITTINTESVCYKNPTVIKTNDIVATMDGFPLNGDQVYTFGPQTQRRINIGYTTTGVVQSTDGINYSDMKTNIGMLPTTYETSESLFLIGRTAATISYSYNGIIYNNINVSSIVGTNSTISGLSYNGKQWIAGCNSVNSSNSVLYSYDGINWVGSGTINGSSTARRAFYNGSSWLIPIGASPYLAYSNNGTIWTSVTGPSGFSSISISDKSIAWNGNLWVVGGSANGTNGQCLAYTNDPNGATGWTFITLNQYKISNSMVFCVIWNGKMFLATGYNGTNGVNSYSYNGINWTQYTLPSPAIGRTLIWTGNMWIHGGNNKILYSYNGINWNDISHLLTITIYSSSMNIYKPHSITFQRNLTIASGSDSTNKLAYSLDGINWRGLGLSTIFTNRGLCAKYNGRLWIAGGQGGNTLAYSYDAISWYGLGSNTFTESCLDIVWNGTLWVGCGRSSTMNGNTLAYSYDGLTWITNTSSNQWFRPSTNPDGGQKILWNGNMWIVVGKGDNTNTNMVYSYDGMNWTSNQLTASASTSTIRSIATNGSMILCCDDGSNSLYYSYNGLNWSSIQISYFTTLYAIYWYNNKWVISGSGSTTTFAYSYDGLNWFNSNSKIYDICRGITHNGTVWVSTGTPSTPSTGNTLAYSYDGINWTGVGTSMFSENGFGISSNYQIVPIPYIQHPAIAVGQGTNTIAYSDTGINWKGLGTTIFSQVGNTVFWNGTIWVAGGQGVNTMAYSQDGIQWSALGTPVFSTATNSVSWNNSYWVACGIGGNTLAYSKDGTIWTGLGSSVFTTQGYGIVWNGITWIAGGQGTNTIAYSQDSIIWTGLSGLPLETYVKSIATNGPICVACGKGTSNTLAYTMDPTVKTGWTGINNTTFSVSANGICWNGTIWVAVGEGVNTIAYSYTGISNWVGLGTSIFSTRGSSVCWNGVRFIAVGQGTNSIAYSQNGITWYKAYNGYSTLLSTQVFTYGNCVASNSTIGAVPIQSQMVLNKNIGISDTLDVVSSDPYYQSGFDNVSIKVEPNSLYNIDYNTSIINPYILLGTTGSYEFVSGYSVVSFLSNGTISLNIKTPITLYYLVVAGGGAGGTTHGGGGGGGGVLQGSFSLSTSDIITVIVGAGGIGSSNASTIQSFGTGGESSIKFNTNTLNDKISNGGGYGGSSSTIQPGNGGNSGGCGGGATQSNNSIASQGNKGGITSGNVGGAGGGGAGQVGGNGGSGGGNGGNGVQCTENGISSKYSSNWGGGGGGGSTTTKGGLGGNGGGGGGGTTSGTLGSGGGGLTNGAAGTRTTGGNGGTNTGGGGGGRPQDGTGLSGNGGSGIVVIAYLGLYNV